MSERKTGPIILVPLVVFVVVGSFFLLGYLVTIAFQVPPRLNFPLPIRFVGLVILLLGVLLLGWLLRYRRPMDILVSTYATFSKMSRGIPLVERFVRTEPLVVKGPYTYVRHPLYFDVVLLLLGWWLLLDYSFLLLSALLLFLWLNFVVAPFEEKELRAIFGEDYERYSKRVPKIVPFTRRRRFQTTN
jgi:protein-S-isoprenylcysteine O-methyltransferase Ste14